MLINVCLLGALVSCVIGITNSLPAPARDLHYETGVTYKYNYHFTILLNEKSNVTSRIKSVGRNVGYKVSSEFLVSPIWQNAENSKEKVLKIELLSPSLHVSSTIQPHEGINKHWSKLDNLSYPPMYIHWYNGEVKKVYVLPELDTKEMINIKKGIASLLQLKMTDGEVEELDVSGMCHVKYKSHGTNIKKSKRSCKRTYNHDKQSTSEILNPTIDKFSEMKYELNPQENIIQSISGKEEIMLTLNLWKQAAMFVKSKMHANFVEQWKTGSVINAKSSGAVLSLISKELHTKLIGEPLEAVSDYSSCPHCRPLSELVSEYGSNLLPGYLGELKSAGGFLKFLNSFRHASKKELLVLFKDTDARILTQLLDVLAASGTDDALDVAFQLVDFESKDVAIAERFLLCLSTAPNPNEAVISKTFKLLNRNIPNEKLRATVLVTLSSLVRTYCHTNSTNSNSPIIDSISSLLLKELSECQDPVCVLSHLLALRNMALPRNLNVLVEYAKHGGVLGLMALEAMKEIGEQHFDKQVNQVLMRVYNEYWPHQESAARVLAAEMLMKSDPTAATMVTIIKSLANPEYPEMNTLVLKALKNTMKEHSGLRACVKDLLSNTTFGNYYYLAQNGTSTKVINELQATQDADIKYGINLEMRNTGMLKRTSFDLNLANEKGKEHLMSLSLFVEGFGLTDEEQKANPEEHSAGMQLSVLGVHLRPYIFFTGTSELMGLVWSGAGSEPTTALQSNFLIMDQSYSVVLQNGIPVEFDLKGALSADIAGSCEVSMWNKNAHAVVKNRGALLVTGNTRADTSFVESHVDFAMGGHSVLDMVVDLDFAHKPMQICLQVEQPAYVFRHNVRKTETIPGSKHLIKTLKRRNMYFPGKSFNLFQKNSDSCRNLLLPKKEKSSFW